MKASELRIGNIVNKKFLGFGTNIPAYTEWSFFRKEEFNEIDLYPDTFSPVLITEEWMARLGFEHRVGKKDEYYAKNGQCFCKQDYPPILAKLYEEVPKKMYLTVYFLYIPESRTVLGVKNPMVYVHQLQNLYFALTGEELTVN